MTASGLYRCDDPGHDVTLLGPQRGTFCCRGTAGEVRYRRAGHQDRVCRGEDAAFAQRTDDPPDMPGGKEFFGRFEQQNPAVQNVGSEREPAGKAPAAANDSDSTATRSPRRALGGRTR
jgi:hypothetical protein